MKRVVARNMSSYPAYVVNAPVTEVSKAANGVRVATEVTPSTRPRLLLVGDTHPMPFCASPFVPPRLQTAPGETATISVYVDGGSRYESSGNNGAAHFLSSLAFSGKNAAAADSLGVFTATAGREQTVYTAKVFKNDVATAMEVLADAVMGTKVTRDPHTS